VFGWFDADPDSPVSGCDEWTAASVLRATLGSDVVDAYYKSRLSIVVDDPETAYPNVNTVWNQFYKTLAEIFFVGGRGKMCFSRITNKIS
jgi:hypothetical protein